MSCDSAATRRSTPTRTATASPARTVAGAGAPTGSPRVLAEPHDGPAFFAGCSEEQADLPFAVRVLLTAPESVLVERLRTRGGYGSDDQQLAQVLADVAEVEPLLRRSADLVLTTTAPPSELADAVLRYIAEGSAASSGG